MWRRVIFGNLKRRISTSTPIILNSNCSLVEPNNSNNFEGQHGFKKQLNLFFDDLAYYPHCTDNFADGQYRAKNRSDQKKYIEFNQPCLVSYFIFDLDYPESALAWQEENLPPPFWVAQNPKNGHVHICYRLLFPYPTTEIASIKPMQYAAKIQAAIGRKLKADAGYSRKLTKNPYNPAWRTMYFTDKSYLLDELADYVVVKALKKSEQEQGLGRNCTMFQQGASWAYTAVMEFKQANTPFQMWHNAVKDRLKDINAGFPEALPYSEVKATAKSIATWVWQRFSEQGLKQWHAEKGRKGGQNLNVELKLIQSVQRSLGKH